LFSMFIVRVSKAVIKRFTRFLRESLVLPIVSIFARRLNLKRTLISVAQFNPYIMSSF
jgi:hypothetical protein